MKAIVCTRYGPPDSLRLEEVEKPTPRDNEVLIKVHAATVNRTDNAYVKAIPWFARIGTGFLRPKYTIPGTEFAGEIVSIGTAVSLFKTGDRVFGFNDRTYGTQAQYMTMAEEGALVTMPEGISFEEASASSEGSFYAINFLNKVEIDSGKKVLVNGATGAIGSAAVQLLKHHGVDITAVCDTKNLELVRSLGANRVIDYTKEDFIVVAVAKGMEGDGKRGGEGDEDTDGDRQGEGGGGLFDYVFDTVGKSSFFKCKPLLKPGGVYISSDLGYLSQNVFLPLLSKVLWKQNVKFPMPQDCPGCIRFIGELMDKGEFKPVIDRTYPLEEAIEAYRYVEKGQKVGNVVITMEHDD